MKHRPTAMVQPARPDTRCRVDGKFFRRAGHKLHLKGVTYGPFAPNADGEPCASPDQTRRDFELIRDLGANLVRVYHVPPRWLLDLAAEHSLLLLIDIPWNKQLVFLDSPEHRRAAREAVRDAVRACARHPAVFAYSVVNEIPADIVRWSGHRAIEEFIDDLVLAAKREDPDCLCTFANYPPTEFLRPQRPDFFCFNVYLHQPHTFKNYLARLQMLADSRPLVLGETGMDSIREGEARKCEFLRGQIEQAFRSGLAGTIVFSFTDDWHKDGRQVEDWALGLTTAGREVKASYRAVQEAFRAAPYFPLPRYPKVSVVVASYNGAATLSACLVSLDQLNYPDYEVILVDDGSTDNTAELVARHPRVRYLRHERNLGLSVARNTGITAGEGEIIAFTDADCRADEDWLHHLVGDLLDSDFAAMGGHNLLPPDDSAVAAAVMVSPGGPAHVMLDDRQAEHIPGCNMAFYRQALLDVGGFDPIFRRAGDDVDICWRLQQAGMKIGFSPAAFVWHYRRSNLRAYLKQQCGYGEAESLLVSKHPEYFNAFGGSVWRGRIYGAAKFGLDLRPPIIYRGPFGSGMFQTLYAAEPAGMLMWLTTLEYHVLVTLPLWVLGVTFHYLLPVALVSLLMSMGVCVAAGMQASLLKSRRRWWSRPLVALLFLLQPVARGWKRYEGRLNLRRPPEPDRETFNSLTLRGVATRLDEVQFWSEQPVDRVGFVAAVVEELHRQRWPNHSDIGWSEFDVEVYGNRWANVQLTTVLEDHPRGQLLRCRLRGRWSLQAKVAFWSLLGLEALVVGLFSGWLNWLGLILLSLPAFVYFLHRQKRKQASLLVVFLEELAEARQLVKITQRPLPPVAGPAQNTPTRAEASLTPPPPATPADKRATVA